MKIGLEELRSLPQGRLHVSFNEKLDGTEAVKPAVGDLTLQAGSTGIRLTGQVHTLLKLQCDRCLSPFFSAISVDIDERFVTAGLTSQWDKAQQKERELTRAEDFCETLPPDNTLDVTDVVYQAVTLATPSSNSCGEQCPGPPLPTGSAKSGALGQSKEGKKRDGQVDPRWKNLKSLLPNEDHSEKS